MADGKTWCDECEWSLIGRSVRPFIHQLKGSIFQAFIKGLAQKQDAGMFIFFSDDAEICTVSVSAITAHPQYITFGRTLGTPQVIKLSKCVRELHFGFHMWPLAMMIGGISSVSEVFNEIPAISGSRFERK